jgi:hypothetical protein
MIVCIDEEDRKSSIANGLGPHFYLAITSDTVQDLAPWMTVPYLVHLDGLLVGDNVPDEVMLLGVTHVESQDER